MRLTIPPEAAGERLDQALAEALGSRAAAARAIEEGRVTVDGRARPKRWLVSGGEDIAVTPPAGDLATAERDSDRPAFAVAWEDEHLLVVDKPAGMVVHPARGHATGTLAQALAARGAAGGDPGRPGIVHRLDRDTSGLLVVARSDAVHRALKAAIQARSVTREYLALVAGRPPARSGTIDAPLGRDRRVRTRMSSDTDAPRAAVTHFELAEALPRHTLLRVRLETGRTHQIRAHLHAIGHPVAGDPEYGGGAPADDLGLDRQFLHAARLAFAHPVTGEPVEVESPLPEDLAAALRRARSAT
jgi:23S rRNA pseudouridine1911/1915/1917 synthase